MPLRDLIKKKEQIASDTTPPVAPPPPEFTFLRSTTTTQEVISPPSHPDDNEKNSKKEGSEAKLRNRFRRTSKQAAPAKDEEEGEKPARDASPTPAKDDSRLSHRLHLRSRSRSTSQSSAHVPENLPTIQASGDQGAEAEAEWEKRATLLAQKNNASGRPGSGHGSKGFDGKAVAQAEASETAKGHRRAISNAEGDVNIQEAIRLHEAGELRKSTEMFGKLADPDGESNALAQVLYGLALRHGWGVEKDTAKAVTFLSHAAANSAAVESSALESGLQKGGAAKGELVLAIYELANSFRNGWGVDKDPVAARQYYETAANLGDTDAMHEVAWCLMEGFGGKKDKYKAAQYLRMAETKGTKTVGNSWIWKEKYNPKTS